MDANKLREFYREKKRTWAKTFDYYTPSRPWGEHYGYDLAEPYSDDEIYQYEQRNGFKIPRDLKHYLKKVSREIYVDGYPTIVKLEENPGTCVIPDGTNYLRETYDDNDNDDDCNCSGMILLSMNGCTFNDYIVINGNGAGYVWYSDGDSMSRRGKFKDYITKQVNPPKPVSMEGMDLKQMAKAFNFLQILNGSATLKYKS
jgi:hypothetical protein